MKTDETNVKVTETVNDSEFVYQKDNQIKQMENVDSDEFVGSKEFGGTNKKSAPTAKINSKLTFMATSLMAVVATVFIGVTNLLNVSLKASINNVLFEDGKLKYEISVTDLNEENVLSLYLDDGDSITKYDIDLSDSTVSGNIDINQTELENKLNTDGIAKYRITLKGTIGLDVERSFDSYVLEIDQMTSIFRKVDGRCQCCNDGYYYFTMDFTDDYGQFTGFKAYIIDNLGIEFSCELTNNLHEEQRIYVANANGKNVKLCIVYYENGVEKIIEQNIEL